MPRVSQQCRWTENEIRRFRHRYIRGQRETLRQTGPSEALRIESPSVRPFLYRVWWPFSASLAIGIPAACAAPGVRSERRLRPPVSVDEQNIDIFDRRDAVNVSHGLPEDFPGYIPKKEPPQFYHQPAGRFWYHVVSGNQGLMSRWRTRKSTRPVRTDPPDLALIQMWGPRQTAHLRLGDSDHLVVGQKVLAIGNPFG